MVGCASDVEPYSAPADPTEPNILTGTYESEAEDCSAPDGALTTSAIHPLDVKIEMAPRVLPTYKKIEPGELVTGAEITIDGILFKGTLSASLLSEKENQKTFSAVFTSDSAGYHRHPILILDTVAKKMEMFRFLEPGEYSSCPEGTTSVLKFKFTPAPQKSGTIIEGPPRSIGSGAPVSRT